MRAMKWLALLVTMLFLTGRVEAAGSEQTRGAQAAKALTTITGVALSPLLGVGAVGAWDYFKTPADKKATLSWYAKPIFWLPALLLAGAVALKDIAGAAIPTGWKKPLDAAETVESKVSGLVATGAFAPIVASFFSHSGLTAHGLNTLGFGSIDFSPLLNILTIPFAMAAFFVVWLVGHVITVLILVSPFGPVDVALKSARTTVMGLLTVIHLINPWYGALLSVLMIIVAYFIAGWSFRVMVFGSVCTWDFFTRRRKRFKPEPNANWMFTARKVEKTPIRSYGKLSKSADGKLTFEYRPWLVFAKCTVTLPVAQYAIGRGLFYPTIMTVDGEKPRAILSMPPRYRKHEDEVSQIYGIRDIRDVGILKGFKAIWRLFTGGETAPVPAAA
jgi:hypothetical protein